jgi:outer membrane lipoprotein-sorting protein
MSCEKCQDKILIFDQLSEAEQDTLLEHIGECDECSEAFEQFLQLEEALDIILEDEAVIIPQKIVKKPNPYKYLKRAALICASLFIICLAAWNTPPVKAAIEKALNELIGNKFLEMDKPLEHGGEDKEKKKDKAKIIYIEYEQSNGERYKSYISGVHYREEFTNGEIRVSNGKLRKVYSKEENTFTITELMGNASQMTQEIFKEMNPDQIKSLGETTIADRKADRYEITFSEEMIAEFWFDKETGYIVKEMPIFDGKAVDDGPKVVEFEVKEYDKNHKLFELEPPEGAEIIEEFNSPIEETDEGSEQ